MKRDRFRRIPERAGHARITALPKGPNGRALCRHCSTEVPQGRLTFCSNRCVHEWKCRTNPSYQRDQVEARDLGICALCRIDAVLARQLWLRVERRAGEVGFFTRPANLTFHRELAKLGVVLPSFRRSWWQMDHIVPVSEGGGDCGLENLRTLCTWCHLAVTAALRKRLRERTGNPGLQPTAG